MAGRGFSVKIELDLQAVTCPGVWLCPNGKVALQIYTFDSCVESNRIEPVFPLLFHDKFVFKKVFTGICTLIDLQHSLEEECFYSKLVQWPTSTRKSIILSTFETNLGDLLYPAPCFKGLLSGVDVDLLMEPTKSFPGIIAPKIEISTRTVVEEVLGICNTAKTRAHVVNPKVINSKNPSCFHRKRPKAGIIRQRRVCHNQGIAICRPCHKDQNIKDINSSTSSDTLENQCYRTKDERPKCICSKSLQKSCENLIVCDNNFHVIHECPVCSKYKCYFPRHHKDNDDTFRHFNRKSKGGFSKPRDFDKISNNSTLYKLDGCICRSNSAPSLQDEPTTSILKSKIGEIGKVKDNLHHHYYNYNSLDSSSTYEREQSRGDQDFYKNLERFYKRMYKHAKLRAQEVNCV